MIITNPLTLCPGYDVAPLVPEPLGVAGCPGYRCPGRD